jgi:hypothetical protein
MRLEVPHGGGLIRVHQPAVASDIGGKNGGEPPVDQGLLGHVSSASVLHIALRIARTVLLDEAIEAVRREGGAVIGPSRRNGPFRSLRRS